MTPADDDTVAEMERRVGDGEAPTAVSAEPGTWVDTPMTDEPVRPVRLEPGALVAGRYRVEGLLGRGGFAEVYRVRDETKVGPLLALKLHRLHRADMLTAIRAEFSLLASLDHPNLASVTDFGQVGDRIAFFTQEIVTGVPCHMAALSATEPRTIRLLAQLCRALDYLHARGVLHRDVKGSNLMVDLERERLTLLDFGIARAFGPGDDTVAGTIGYLAPEFYGGGSVDGRADLYALGVVLYRMIVGRRPFVGAHEAVITAQLFGDPVVVPEGATSPAIARVVERLLSREPAARHASAGELIDDLGRAAGVQLPAESSEALASYVLSAPTVADAEATRRIRYGTEENAAGRVTVVIGAGGTGKSRLLRDRRVEVLLDRRRWIGVSASRTDDGRGLVLELARALVTPVVAEQLSEDARIELARAMPELRRPEEQIAVAVDPELARVARFAVLARVVESRCPRGTGVLVIEDLHHANDDVVSQVAELIAVCRERGAPAAFVITTRPFPALATFLSAVSPSSRVDTGALDPTRARALVEGVFGDATLIDGTPFGDAIGEPRTVLEVQETLRLALDRGDVVRSDGRWRVLRPLSAPALDSVLAERVALRSERARRLLVAAAVLGRAAPLATLAEVSRAGTLAEVAEACAELVRSGLVDDDPHTAGPVTYEVHDRFADVVLAGADADTRREMHASAAARLAHTAGDDWRQLGRAAEHQRLAGDDAKARELLSRGVEIARTAGRPDAACRFVMRQLELGESSVVLLLRRADLAIQAGLGALVAEAIDDLRAALDRATPREAQEISLRIARTAAVGGDSEDAQRRAEEGLRHAIERGTEDLELAWRLVGAQVEAFYGKLSRARDRFEVAAALAARRGDRVSETRAWLGASHAAQSRLEVDASVDLARRAVDAAPLGEPGLRSESLRMLGNVHRVRGDQLEAKRLMHEAVAVARASGSSEEEAKALNNLAIDASRLGDLPEALRASRRSIRLKERSRAAVSVEISRNNLGYLLSSLGRVDEARAIFEGVAARGFNLTIASFANANLGELALREERLEEAHELFTRGLAVSEKHDYSATRGYSLSGLIRTHLACGQVDEAESHLDALRSLTVGLDFESSRVYTSEALLRGQRGDVHGALESARRGTENPSLGAYLFGTLGSRVEACWVHALAASKAGRDGEARDMCSSAQLALSWLAATLETEAERRMFMENHPMRPAVMASDLELPSGRTWRPRG